MLLDVGSLMFNMLLDSHGGTPSWGTSLGQGFEYKYSVSDIGEILTGMVFKKTNDNDEVWCPLGKGGNRQSDYSYILSSLFTKVYFNNVLIKDASFLLLIVKQVSNDNGYHIGRQTLKYSPRIKYNNKEINGDCFDKIRKQFNLNEQSAWFINEIKIKNQDELHFIGYICDINTLQFSDTQKRHEYVNKIIKENGGIVDDNAFTNGEIIPNLYGIHIKNANTSLSNSDPHICIGWSFLGDLSNIKSKDELKKIYSEMVPDGNPNSIAQNVGQIWRFIGEAKVGDYVLFGDNSLFHIGRITSNYYYDDSLISGQDSDYVNNRKVEWISKNIPKNILSQKFQNSIGSAMSFFSLNDYKGVITDILNDAYTKDDESETLINFGFNISSIKDGQNLIVYGTPGCGKSYYVEHELTKDYKEENKIRTTFYQDYTNTDFVGQILPVVEGDSVKYEFTPGPFTLALEQAIKEPEEKVALIIEELNRGSAASIFGDIFQLLDRDDNGVSVYPIKNVNIINYLNKEFAESYQFKDVKIPSNLSVFATMNTSDQNVFTLDTAFKRRWNFKKLTNEFDADHKYKDYYIPGDESINYTWKYLVESLNNFMLNLQDGFNSEDKQIGVYFVDGSVMRKDVTIVSSNEDVEKFAYKMFEYLWDDVAKFNRDKWFDDSIKSLDQLVEMFKKDGLNVFNRDVFKNKN